MVGTHAGDMIGEIALAIDLRLAVEVPLYFSRQAEMLAGAKLLLGIPFYAGICRYVELHGAVSGRGLAADRRAGHGHALVGLLSVGDPTDSLGRVRHGVPLTSHGPCSS